VPYLKVGLRYAWWR